MEGKRYANARAVCMHCRTMYQAQTSNQVFTTQKDENIMEFFMLAETGRPHELFADRQILNALAKYFSVVVNKLFLRGDAVISGASSDHQNSH